MREIRPSGSVRGADREVRPYRDTLLPMRSMALDPERISMGIGEHTLEMIAVVTRPLTE
jgi:hypothetical protein